MGIGLQITSGSPLGDGLSFAGVSGVREGALVTASVDLIQLISYCIIAIIPLQNVFQNRSLKLKLKLKS